MKHSLFELATMTFNASIFFWVTLYRPWRASQRLDRAAKAMREEQASPSL